MMKKTPEKYPINNSCLFRLSNKKKLAAILNLDVKILKNKQYKDLIRYTVFENKKRRVIYNPSKELKSIQKKLLKYFARIETPLYLKSGKKGVSYIDNAEVHLNNHYVITTDIAGFYSNCKRINVFKMLVNKFKMAKDIAGIITDMVCYDNFIPTGSPTSQMIAYFTYSDTFDKIYELANLSNCEFSLYVDDMTFSSLKSINRSLIHEVNKNLLRYGLKLKPSKTKIYRKCENSIITGVVKDKYGKMRVPNKLRLSIINYYKQYQISTCDEKKELYLKLKGKLQAARTIENDIFLSLTKLLN